MPLRRYLGVALGKTRLFGSESVRHPTYANPGTEEFVGVFTIVSQSSTIVFYKRRRNEYSIAPDRTVRSSKITSMSRESPSSFFIDITYQNYCTPL